MKKLVSLIIFAVIMLLPVHVFGQNNLEAKVDSLSSEVRILKDKVNYLDLLAQLIHNNSQLESMDHNIHFQILEIRMDFLHQNYNTVTYSINEKIYKEYVETLSLTRECVNEIKKIYNSYLSKGCPQKSDKMILDMQLLYADEEMKNVENQLDVLKSFLELYRKCLK